MADTPNARTIRVYLSARISIDAHAWNREVCGALSAPFEVFMPQDVNPWQSSHETFSLDVYQLDLAAMESSDLGLLLPEYGRDCAWEAGWYANSPKPLVAFVHAQTEWLRDWMVKGGLDHVLTTDPSTFETLRRDPILRTKRVELLPSLAQLPEALLRIVEAPPGAAERRPSRSAHGHQVGPRGA